MSTEHIVSLLIEERDRIQAAITALHDTPAPEPDNVPDWVLPKGKTAPKKKKMSAATRKRIGAATRARWAARRAAKAQGDAPKVSKKSAIRAAVTPSAEDVEFKAKMSAAMKKAWAKRRKAKKKGM